MENYETMKNIGDVSAFPELRQIYQAICNKQTHWAHNGERHEVGYFQGKKLHYVDHNGMRYVEQNPNSSSAYAARARQGAKIVWVIRLSDNQYRGRIENGEVWMKPHVSAQHQ